MNNIPDKVKNKDLYKKVRSEIFKKYPKHSAYRSGLVMKEYQKQGGKLDEKKKKDSGLERWFDEKWVNLTPYSEGLGNKLQFPCGKRADKQKGPSVCRPSIKVNKDTPSLAQSYSKKQIQKAVSIKKKGKVIKWYDL